MHYKLRIRGRTLAFQPEIVNLTLYRSFRETMKNFKAFSFLGLLFALVLLASTVTADEKSKKENEAAVVDGKTKETNPVPDDVEKQGYGGGGGGYGGGGGGGCGRCCWKHGYHYCGSQCCWPQSEETEAVSEATADASPDRWGWGGGRGGGGWGGGRGGGGWGGGRGGGGWGGGGRGGGGGWGGGGGANPDGYAVDEATADANPDRWGWGGGRGGGGWGGGRGGGGWGGGGKGGGGWGGGGGANPDGYGRGGHGGGGWGGHGGGGWGGGGKGGKGGGKGGGGGGK